ncbi:MAG: bifunctional riboflavin kinase/FAD synthetase [Thermonemataceae bacterium]|nr:bifunctional riboflavin kinase/FAD synthetase [Thermonemataceae bacterium]
MQIFRDTTHFPVLPYVVLSSGSFDGIHLGHQQILKRLVQIAKENKGQSVIITFFPHPRLFFGQEVSLLNTLEEKIILLDKIGIDYLLILPFDKELANYTAEEFIQKIYIETTHTKKLVIGYDHHFGKGREGNFTFLAKNITQYPFQIEEIPAKDIDNIAISSTKIRKALLSGDTKTACLYLGRPYSLKGKVIQGDKLGRKLGFPTANLEIAEAYKLIPKEGVYAVEVFWKTNKYEGMLHIGRRPTLQKQNDLRIEVHLLNFEQEIYDEYLELHFIDFIRENIKFENLEQLTQQLAEDKIICIKQLETYKNSNKK